MEPIFQEAQALQDEIVAWRRQLHRIPEIGLVVPQTIAFLKKQLEALGLTWQEYQGHSGITVCIGQGPHTAALRADIDGLPIQEETGLSYASENGNMHACGHDAHAAMLLGAAKLLKQHENELKGVVKLIFQPGEEGPGGASLMVHDGVLTDVDAIFALHAGSIAGFLPAGGVAVSWSDTFAADDQVNIRIKGLGGHGSTPHSCVDPVTVAGQIINNLQYIISRELDSHDAAVITIASVEAGQGTFNVIPETALLKGTIRNASPATRDFVLRRIEEVAKSTAEMMRASCTVEFLDGYPALINDRSMVESFLRTARKLLREEEICILPHGLMGGEDAAFFFQEVPGCYFFLPGVLPCPAGGGVFGAHHPKFCLDESVFWRGTGLMAQSAIDWLENAAT